MTVRACRVVVAGLLGFGLVACTTSSTETQPGVEPIAEISDADFAYYIPAGTGDRMDAGESVEILPARIDANVGQSIVVRNDDTRGHTVGWMYVGPGETVSQQFSSTGSFVGVCTVHPSGQVELVVSE